ncbi:MAG: hypothetical protein ACI9JD_002582 [Rhodococcus sp. (in: high G+C Gram-positive bacteria)]
MRVKDVVPHQLQRHSDHHAHPSALPVTAQCPMSRNYPSGYAW